MNRAAPHDDVAFAGLSMSKLDARYQLRSWARLRTL